ncbi:hypothetical protein [Nocardia sp. CA-119907]|uniref:hypothetical protein n=1 Tax=Nocardia sp. CA-119907 TaxID=3239973 RepID=UPI003D962EFA
MNEGHLNEIELARLADGLRNLPERTPEPVEEPSAWLQHDDGTWSPVYPDGRTGTPFSYAQMIAFKGEDIGTLLEALVEAGLVTDIQPGTIDVFEPKATEPTE